MGRVKKGPQRKTKTIVDKTVENQDMNDCCSGVEEAVLFEDGGSKGNEGFYDAKRYKGEGTLTEFAAVVVKEEKLEADEPKGNILPLLHKDIVVELDEEIQMVTSQSIVELEDSHAQDNKESKEFVDVSMLSSQEVDKGSQFNDIRGHGDGNLTDKRREEQTTQESQSHIELTSSTLLIREYESNTCKLLKGSPFKKANDKTDKICFTPAIPFEETEFWNINNVSALIGEKKSYLSDEDALKNTRRQIQL